MTQKPIYVPHVLVTIPTANHTQRCMLEGVLDYAREHGPWMFHLNTGDIAGQGIRRVGKWGCTGVIAMSANKEAITRISRLRLPAVFINPAVATTPPRGCVFVARNQRNMGCIAAEYFISRGYRSFAFVGSAHATAWSDERKAGFVERIADEGLTCTTYAGPDPEGEDDFAAEAPRLGKWLASLPRPTALYTVKDMRGQQILSLCLDRGIAVPGDLAVLSTDDDAVLCETATPALSSISLDGRNTGRMCARILDDLMHGRPTEPVVDIAYPRIVTRSSTDAFAIGDPILARVLSHARANTGEAAKIGAIAHELGISPRTIELKALRHFGRPIREVLLRMRLADGVAMLSNTDLPLAEIAERCGFCNASHFSRTVKAAFGYSPGTFRAKARV